MKLLLLALVLVLPGCASMYQGMSPEAIKAAAGDDKVVCAIGPTPWGVTRVTVIDLKRSSGVADGIVEIHPDCSAKITNTPHDKPIPLVSTPTAKVTP